MSIDETVSFSLEVNVGKAEDEVRRLLTVLNRTFSLANRMFGTENIPEGIKLMQKATTIANQLRLAYRALQAVRLAAGDPLAWAMLVISAAEVTVSVANELEMRSPEY